MRTVDNSPDVIKKLVNEMLDSNGSKSISTIESSAIAEIVKKINSYEGAKISTAFIRMHADIFVELNYLLDVNYDY
jgi:polyribonucleotide nucleotidyltransferase